MLTAIVVLSIALLACVGAAVLLIREAYRCEKCGDVDRTTASRDGRQECETCQLMRRVMQANRVTPRPDPLLPNSRHQSWKAIIQANKDRYL